MRRSLRAIFRSRDHCRRWEAGMEIPKPLDTLSVEERSLVLRNMRAVRFGAGDCIFPAGSPGDGCFLIEEGDVRLEFEGIEHVDTERVLGYITPGALLGGLAVRHGPHTSV